MQCAETVCRKFHANPPPKSLPTAQQPNVHLGRSLKTERRLGAREAVLRVQKLRWRLGHGARNLGVSTGTPQTGRGASTDPSPPEPDSNRPLCWNPSLLVPFWEGWAWEGFSGGRVLGLQPTLGRWTGSLYKVSTAGTWMLSRYFQKIDLKGHQSLGLPGTCPPWAPGGPRMMFHRYEWGQTHPYQRRVVPFLSGLIFATLKACLLDLYHRVPTGFRDLETHTEYGINLRLNIEKISNHF